MKEKCCGCLIIKNDKILLVYEKDPKFWGFPKGHVEEGETEVETALREVKEETDLDVKIDESKRYVITYVIKDNIEKTCVFFKAYPLSDNIKMQPSEIAKTKWCDKDEALSLIKYDNLKNILKEVM